LFFISIPFILVRRSRDQGLAFSFLPLLPGLIRLCACLSNIALMTGV